MVGLARLTLCTKDMYIYPADIPRPVSPADHFAIALKSPDRLRTSEIVGRPVFFFSRHRLKISGTKWNEDQQHVAHVGMFGLTATTYG